MSYTAPNRLFMPMRHSIDTVTDSWRLSSAAMNTGLNFTANLAFYVPLAVPRCVVVRKLWFASGSPSTGNVDMGLYNSQGVAVISATATAKASSREQVFDVTDTAIGPGLYYIALVSDSNTDGFEGEQPAAPTACAFGVLTEATAYPLPATATWVVNQTNLVIPAMGLLLTTVVS